MDIATIFAGAVKRRVFRARIFALDGQISSLNAALRPAHEEREAFGAPKWSRQTHVACIRDRGAVAETNLGVTRFRIAELDHDYSIASLEAELCSIRDERKALQGELDAYKYPVLTLPLEVVSKNFLQFVPVYPDVAPAIGFLSPARLGQICRQWRAIAFSTPSLWRAIELTFNNIADGKQLSVLESWLVRSKSCPLSVTVYPQLHDDAEYLNPQTPIMLSALLNILSGASKRIQYLQFSLIWRDHLETFEADMPLLRRVTTGRVAKQGSPTQRLVLMNAPRLQHIVLSRDFDSTKIIFPWIQLTTLVVESASESFCWEVLHHATNLVLCRLGLFSRLEAAPPGQMVLPRLESFRLVRSPWVAGRHHLFLLNLLILPSLKTLMIEESLFADEDPRTSIATLILRSRCTLDELRVTRCQRSARFYRDSFPSVRACAVEYDLEVT
ncbi:hypothetical protein C8J57DRAFT_1524157 [Mycena rebaudengoi]|nr:hypothetical protein C8J57DRAFT_1524157 [Mycena rebaudengoi]